MSHPRLSTTLLTLLALTTSGLDAGAQGLTEPYLPGSRRQIITDKEASLPCGEVRLRTIQSPGGTAAFVFEGVAGDVVDLTMVELSGFASSFPQATLRAPSGAEVGSFNGTTVRGFLLAETGRHIVRVTATQPGTVSMGLWCRPPAGASTSLACGTQAPASLSEVGEVHYYTFSAQANDAVQIALVESSGFPASAPRGTLFSPAGVELGSFDADNLTPFELQETGTFTIRIRANTLAGLGSYEVGLSCAPPAGTPQVLGCGTLLPSTLAPGAAEYYTFDGDVDMVVELRVALTSGFSSKSAPQMQITSPSGVNLGIFSATSLTQLTLLEQGTYTVRIASSAPGDSGQYALGFDCRDPLGPATALACGASISATISAAAESDNYSFSGIADDIAEITLTTSAGFVGSTAQMRVFSPSGLDLGAFDADSVNPIALPEAGTYSVRVTANTLLGTGSYSIALTCIAGPATSVHLGSASLTTASIDVAAETDCFTFDGGAGDVVDLILVQTSGFAGTLATGTLFSMVGTNLGSFNANSLTSFTLPATERYTVKVQALNMVSTGVYSLGFERFLPREPLSPPLVCGQLVSAGLDVAGDVDYYTFNGSLDDVVELTLVRTSGAGLPSMTVFSPTGVDLGTFNANSLNELTLSESGTHSIRLAATNLVSTATYNLGLECRSPLGPVESHLVCGDLASNTFAAAGEVDYYTFNGAIDDVVELTIVQTVGPAVGNIRVFSPSNVDLGSFNANSRAVLTLAEAGIYSVRVAATNLVSLGSYNLGLECRSPLGPVEAHMECGDLVSNSFVASGEVDYFTFDGTSSDVVELTIVRTAGGSLPSITVFSPSGTDLGTFNANTQNALALPETGTYAVRVSTTSLVGTASYNLGLECRSPLGPIEAHMACGDLLSNSFATSGEVDYFTFTGTSSDVVELTIVQTVGPAVANMRVFSPSGSDLGSSNANSRKVLTLTETGTYSVRVVATNLVSLGSYNIGLECRSPLGPVEAHMECGDLVSNSFVASGEVDYFTFDGTSSDAVELTIVRTAGGSLPSITVFSPSGTDLGTFNANTQNALTLPETGTYAVRVSTTSLVGTASYNLGLECRSPLGPIEAHMACGDLLSNSFATSGEVDYFTFTGTSSDVVELTIVQTVGPAVARMQVFSPSGTDLGAFNANSRAVLTLPEAGTYSVRVAATNLVSLGSYNLGLECRSPLGPVEANLSAGDLVSNSFVASGETDYFTFGGAVGDMVELTLVRTTGGALPRMTVFSPTGTDLGSFNANSLNELTLPETGTYAVRVAASGLVGTATYNLGLESRSPLGPVEANLSCAGVVSNSFVSSGEVDYFTFSGSASDLVDLTITQTLGPAVANITVFSPSGTNLGSFNANSTNQLNLPETGTYAVRVVATNLISSGSYNLGLACP